MLHNAALKYLSEQMGMITDEVVASRSVMSTDTHFGIHPFYIRRGTFLIMDYFVSIKTNLMWPEVKHICLYFN